MTILNLCAGPGGWEEGAAITGITEPIEGVELNQAAADTAVAAGHTRTVADINDLEPASYSHITGLIASTPCPTFSASGKRTGTGDDYQTVLDVITHLGMHECDCTWSQIAAELGVVADARTALAALPVRLALSEQMSRLEWIAFEQVPSASHMFEDIAAELYAARWQAVDTAVIEAHQLGMPVRRRRAFLIAHRTAPVHLGLPQGPARSMAHTLGWDPGHRVNTRGAGSSGGNEFSADGPSWCLTGSARTWARVSDGKRLSVDQAARLQGFRPDYPFTGSRTAAFRQIADVVLPPVAATVLGAATGGSAEGAVSAYCHSLYD